MQGDNQSRRCSLSAQPLDDSLDLGGQFMCALGGAAPTGVVEVAGSVERDPDRNLVTAEEFDVRVGDQGPVGLQAVRPRPGKPPRPEAFQLGNGRRSGSPPNKDEFTALALDGRHHGVEVVLMEDVPGVPLGILVAVLALDVTLHTKGSKFNDHRHPPAKRLTRNQDDHEGISTE